MTDDGTSTKKSIWSHLKTPLVVCLPALWPYLIFLNENKSESFSVLRLGLYAVATILVVWVGFFVFRFATSKWLSKHRGAIIYSVCVFSFFGYSVTYTIAGALFSGFYLKTWAVFFVVVVSLTWVMSRFKLFMDQVFVFSIVIVAMPLIQFLAFHAEVFLTTDKNRTDVTNEMHVELSESAPSVYYIILDEYGRADVLRDLYGFDNSEFIQNLEERGFYVAGQSTSNYPYTVASLSTTLAMNYHYIGPATPKAHFESAQMIYQSNSPVHDFFRRAGYEIASLRWNGADCAGDYPDYCFSTRGLYFGDLEANLIKLTPFNSLIHVLLNEALAPEYFELSDVQNYLEGLQYEKPLFALIHALIPHGPNRFTRTCEPISADEQLAETDEAKGYIEQVQCANKGSLTLVDTISRLDPGSIVIFQSDHGPKININWADLEEVNDTWEQSYSNLNAWYFPPNLDCKKYLKPNLTAVNTFRIVQGCLTGNAPELLRDRWFFVSAENQSEQIYTEIIP